MTDSTVTLRLIRTLEDGRYEVECDKGHKMIYTRRYFNLKHNGKWIQSKQRCMEHFKQEKKPKVEDIQKLTKSLTVLDFNDYTVTVKCERGHITEKPYRNFKACPYCKTCGIRREEKIRIGKFDTSNIDKILQSQSCIRLRKPTTDGKYHLVYNFKTKCIELRHIKHSILYPSEQEIGKYDLEPENI